MPFLQLEKADYRNGFFLCNKSTGCASGAKELIARGRDKETPFD
jgi:hypothetical protein